MILVYRTCSQLKELCSPALFEDLDFLKPFDTVDHSILSQYSRHAKNLRILLGIISDDIAAMVINCCKNTISVSLYHESFEPNPGEFENGVFWMSQINQIILSWLEQGNLNGIGFYGCEVLDDDDPFSRGDDIHGPLPLLQAVSRSVKARTALKRLDISIYTIKMDLYTIIRRDFPSLESLSFNYALRTESVDPLWDPLCEPKWAHYAKLTSIQFKLCSNVYAGHISYLVRHFPALKYLMLSTCGSVNDKITPGPPEGWYTGSHALWKTHIPLDAIRLEHMSDWEIRAMADIPTKSLVVTNIRGDFLTETLERDSKYFPGLQTIRIQGDIPEYDEGVHPFSEGRLSALEEVCKKRGITLRRDAKAMMLFPRHYY